MKRLYTASLLLVFGLGHVHAQAAPTAVVTWAAPTVNTDGSTITATLAYNLYQGLQSAGTLTKVASSIAGLTVSVTAGLTPGSTQCFAVTAIEAGVESAQSNKACATIALPTPGVPSQITVVVH